MVPGLTCLKVFGYFRLDIWIIQNPQTEMEKLMDMKKESEAYSGYNAAVMVPGLTCL